LTKGASKGPLYPQRSERPGEPGCSSNTRGGDHEHPADGQSRALGRADQLKGHLERALANGVTRQEIGESITHLAFYAGWPASMTAGRIAKQVFDAQR
jgi:hypothetical protein